MCKSNIEKVMEEVIEVLIEVMG